MTHPAFAEMKASREAKLNSMVGKGEAHHELPSEKADRLAVKGDTYPSPQKFADGGITATDPAAEPYVDGGNPMPDYHRSIDDIVKEGSNPSGKSRFTSSSSRNPDPDYPHPKD
jgi:hypothetical protein